MNNSDSYIDQYSSKFVENWDQLSNWEERDRHEGSFFCDKLKAFKCHKILDAATGTGYHSIKLIKKGFEVISLDGSKNMLSKANKNALNKGIKLNTLNCDWRDLSAKIPNNSIDAIVCLGNSFTHLFEESAKELTIQNFYLLLKRKGILIIDHRNYDSMLKGKITKESPYYYPSEKSMVDLKYIDHDLVRYQYSCSDGSIFYLNMHPILSKDLYDYTASVGFNLIDTYYDLNVQFSSDSSFIQHIFLKP